MTKIFKNKVYGHMTKFSCLVLMSVMIFSSCSDDDIITKAEENLIDQKGSIVIINNVQGGFFNLSDKENTSVAFDLGTAGEDVNSINVYKSLNGAERLLHANVSPGTVTVTLEEALMDTGFSLDDIEVGDVFSFSFDPITSSGTYRSGKTLDVAASCPSDLEGTYFGEATGTSTDACCPGTTSSSGEVTLTALGGGSYTISDWSANLYMTWYGPDGGNYGIDQTFVDGGGMNATISELCGEIFGAFNEPFATPTNLSGSVDPNTGVITFSWITGYDDSADVILTPM